MEIFELILLCIVLMLGMFLMLVLSVVFHEIGHVFAAKLCGLKVPYMIFGNSIKRIENRGKWKISVGNTKIVFPKVLFFTKAFTLVKLKGASGRQQIIVASGGVIMNLILMLTYVSVIGINGLINDITMCLENCSSVDDLTILGIFFMFFNLLLFLGNILPIFSMSDGCFIFKKTSVESFHDEYKNLAYQVNNSFLKLSKAEFDKLDI